MDASHLMSLFDFAAGPVRSLLLSECLESSENKVIPDASIFIVS
jgi:hypothetical protein